MKYRLWLRNVAHLGLVVVQADGFEHHHSPKGPSRAKEGQWLVGSNQTLSVAFIYLTLTLSLIPFVKA